MRTINTINQAETTTLVNRKLHLTYQCPAEFEGSLSWTQPILSIPAPCSPKNITLDLPYTRANWLGATAPEDECEGLVQLFRTSQTILRLQLTLDWSKISDLSRIRNYELVANYDYLWGHPRWQWAYPDLYWIGCGYG